MTYSFSSLFGSLLSWIGGILFFVPVQLLSLVSLLLPECSSLGLVVVSQETMQGFADLVGVLAPVLRLVNWSAWGELVSAFVLYWGFRFVWNNWYMIANFVGQWWWIIALLYVVLPLANFFLGNDWMNNTIFSDVFGASPTSTEVFSGGGLGGGGGGSW